MSDPASSVPVWELPKAIKGVVDEAGSCCDCAGGLLYWLHYSPPSSGTGGAFFFPGRTLMAAIERVAVFLDFQNVHLVGHGLFTSGPEPYRCVPDPVRVADLIASRRRRPSVAASIRVYRGRPDPRHQPLVAASNDAQASVWTRDRRVTMVRRQLNYRGWPELPGQEKGIDVAIAVDLMTLAFRGDYDALVLFSSDADLLPALESIISLRLGHVEVACWTGAKSLRIADSKPPRPWCHRLSRSDWQAVTEDWQGRVTGGRLAKRAAGAAVLSRWRMCPSVGRTLRASVSCQGGACPRARPIHRLRHTRNRHLPA